MHLKKHHQIKKLRPPTPNTMLKIDLTVQNVSINNVNSVDSPTISDTIAHNINNIK
jgi:hypothetical protein